MLTEQEISDLVKQYEEDEDLSIHFGRSYDKEELDEEYQDLVGSDDPPGLWYTVSKESCIEEKPYEVRCWEGTMLEWMERDYYDWQFTTVRECLELGERFVSGKLTEDDWELRK